MFKFAKICKEQMMMNENILKNVISGDETSVYGYDNEIKCCCHQPRALI
jgi:hypothetical protein